MKAIRWFLQRAHREAVAVVRETDAVWLKRDVMDEMDMSTSDVYGYNNWYFAYDVIGYTDHRYVFHEDVGCDALSDPVKRIPETKALKWNYDYCSECVDR